MSIALSLPPFNEVTNFSTALCFIFHISGTLGSSIYSSFSSNLEGGSFLGTVNIITTGIISDNLGLPITLGTINDSIVTVFNIDLKDSLGNIIYNIDSTSSQVRARVYSVFESNTWYDGILLDVSITGLTLLFPRPFTGRGTAISTDINNIKADFPTSLSFINSGAREINIISGSIAN